MAGQMEVATPGPGDAVKAMMQRAREHWRSLPPAQQRLLLLTVTALVVLSALSFWWSARVDWRTLFIGMDGRDAAVMQQELSSAGIRFQTSPDGTAIEVPAEQLDKARVAISANGLPQSGRLGFELFDKPNWIGSEFDERVNYQRALEGELEHTIATLESVRSARVHLVLPKHGAFASEDEPAKASVVLKLRRSDLPREQSDAMRTLVAGAVEGLTADSVVLVDADGRNSFSLMTRAGAGREEEQALQTKLTQVLEPLAGAGNVHATVSLSFAQGSEEHTDEVYDPKAATPLSVHRAEQASQQTRAGGVAGTQSNAPSTVPTAGNTVPNSASATAAANTGLISMPGQAQNTRDENTQYAVSRHVSHTEEAPGRIRRITAAIVVNDREVPQTSGKTTHMVWQHRTNEEMKQLQLLAEAAVGFDEKRGDAVVLQDVAFSGNTDQPAAAGFASVATSASEALRSQPTLIKTLASLAGLVLLGLLVLRPLTKQTQQLLAAPAARPLLEAPALTPAALSTSDTHEPEGAAPINTQHIFNRVTEQIRTETESSTRLIGAWISNGIEERD